MARHQSADSIIRNTRQAERFVETHPHIENSGMVLPNNSGEHIKGLKREVPLNDYDITNKKYVDDAVAGAGGIPDPVTSDINITKTDATLKLETADASNPKITFKTTNTPNEMCFGLIENVTADHMHLCGKTAAVDTKVHIVGVAGQDAEIGVLANSTETNKTIIKQLNAGDNEIYNLFLNGDQVHYVNDGGVKTERLRIDGATATTTITGNLEVTGTVDGIDIATDVTANSLKNTDVDHNVTTNLSAGTRTATTIDVNSSDGTNATLVEADTTNAGILGSDKWDEIVANSNKNTNVSTNLSMGTVDGTQYNINSSDGNNVALSLATTDNWGIISDEMFDQLATAVTHYGDNTQAHSDYLLNSGADVAVGPLTITADNSTADQAYVPMVLYNTDDTPPTASGFPVGTIYIQYTA